VIEMHRPETSPTLLAQKLRDEIQRQQQLDTSPAAALANRIAYRQSQLDHINILLNGAAAQAQPRSKLPNKFQRLPILSSGKIQRLLLKAYNFLFKEHRTVNLATIQAVRETAGLNQHLSEQTIALEGFLQSVNAAVGERCGRLEGQVAGIEVRLADVETRLLHLEQSFRETGLHVQSSQTVFQQQFVNLENRLGMAERSIQFLEKNHGDRLRYLQTDFTQQKRLMTLLLEQRQQNSNLAPATDSLPFSDTTEQQIQSEQERLLDVFYRAFEDHFRGDRSKIRERLRIYLPILRDANITPQDLALDVGCGRGEWLELLRDEGFQAKGLDLNQAMLEQCRELNLDVHEGDVLTYIKALPDQSLGLLTGFHIVEHLPFAVLVELMGEAYRVLKSGGVLIFETPNPRNVIVGSCNFYFDPTHNNPIPGEILQFMANYSGFELAHILPLNPSDNPRVLEDSDLAHRFNELFYGSMDYAVIGYKE
jgi:SAM-dependent methyltransferase